MCNMEQDISSSMRGSAFWSQIWKNEFLASLLPEESTNAFEKSSRANNWDKSEKIRLDGGRRAADLDLLPSWSVLDIGPGPGTLAIPIAKKVKHVTVIEPSLAMIDHLKSHVQDARVSNIDIIHSRWEDTSLETIGLHDIVIASYSLNYLDIEAALLKMDQVAQKMVYLYWFAGITTLEKIRIDLYPVIFARRYNPFPKCNIIYNLLYNKGIFPEIKVLDTSYSQEYSDIEEVVSEIKDILNISTNEHDEFLAEYVTKTFQNTAHPPIIHDDTTYVRLSWKPKVNQPLIDSRSAYFIARSR